VMSNFIDKTIQRFKIYRKNLLRPSSQRFN
jgi:hypothetical protein